VQWSCGSTNSIPASHPAAQLHFRLSANLIAASGGFGHLQLDSTPILPFTDRSALVDPGDFSPIRSRPGNLLSPDPPIGFR
jgi:hypothetical protein